MAEQNVFKRIEKKYQLSREQCEAFLEKAGNRICTDEYGLHTIHNIYYDTDNYRLIRNSLEKPKYKEKFRIRGYGEVNENSRIFLEIKKNIRALYTNEGWRFRQIRQRLISKKEESLRSRTRSSGKSIIL